MRNSEYSSFIALKNTNKIKNNLFNFIKYFMEDFFYFKNSLIELPVFFKIYCIVYSNLFEILDVSIFFHSSIIK